MKRKPPGRLRSNLKKKLLPEADVAALAHEIGEFLNTRAGQSARDKNFAYILALYLAQKYSFSDRKGGKLRRLIERPPDDVTTFLDEMSFKDALAFVKTPDAHQQPKTLMELVQAILKPPDEIPPSVPLRDSEPPRRKKRRRARPKTENERVKRRKEAKNRYEECRREYRRGLIIEQFGTCPFPNPLSP